MGEWRQALQFIEIFINLPLGIEVPREKKRMQAIQ